jgi:hypothetical protein
VLHAALSWAGLQPSPAGLRVARRIVLALAALYVATFAAFYPQAITVSDELNYVLHSRMILEGMDRIEKINPLTERPIELVPSRFPAGTALWMTPFVAMGGWRAAFAASCLALVLALALTAWWLAAEGRSPIWTLLVLGFPPTVALGRLAMSDALSCTLAALGLGLFWRGLDRGAQWWLAAGFVAGLSLLVRETNAIVFVFFFAGAVLRREAGAAALVVGGLLGIGVRAIVAQWLFGDPFFYKPPSAFVLESAGENLLFYGLVLIVLVPGGLLAGLAYRGRRWPELVLTVVASVVFFSLYGYSAEESGLQKRLVLAPRYFLPLLPVIAFAAAEVAPRLWGRIRSRGLLARRPWLPAFAGGALIV